MMFHISTPFVIKASVLLAFLTAQILLAADQASIQGVVSDILDEPVPAADVTLSYLANGALQHTTTDTTGNFSFLDIPPGDYRLFIRAKGFLTSVKDLDLAPGQVGATHIQLHSRPSPMISAHFGTPRRAVYNAVFDPTYPDTNDNLYDGLETQVRFFIGEPDRKNGLTPRNWIVNPNILSRTQSLALSVTINCIPCASDTVQTQPITYESKELRSSEAVFHFVARRDLAGKDGAGDIIFSVSAKGLELDRIVAHVFVGEHQKESVFRGDHVFSSEVPEAEPGDLSLILSSDQTGTLSVQLDTSNAELLARFHGRHLDGDHLRRFSVPMNVSDLQVNAFGAYVQLRAIVDQYDKVLQQTLTGAPNKGTQLSAAAPIQFTQEDHRKVIELLSDIGTTLYRRLFVNKGVDPDLKQLMREFKDFSPPGKTIHVRICTKNVYFPWQLLHPPGTPDENLFWGVRYVLTVDSLDRSIEGRLPGMLIIHNGSDHIFAAYHNNRPSEGDEVAALAGEQYTHYTEKFRQNVHLVKSSSELMQLLRLGAKTVSTIFAYTHGTSGVEFERQSSGAITVATDIRGPRLLFEENSYVTPANLETLMNSLDEDQTVFFEESPLIILNACETGVVGIPPMYGPGFPDTLLRMGARGIIVTDSPVWAYFAYHFGNYLIDQLRTGVPAPEALFEARKVYLKARNPLGLLYAYYGAPDVRLLVHPALTEQARLREGLFSQIDSFSTKGVLTHDDAGSLKEMVNYRMDGEIGTGNILSYCIGLGKFNDRILALKSHGTITAAAAESLIGKAKKIVLELSCRAFVAEDIHWWLSSESGRALRDWYLKSMSEADK